MTDFEVNPGDVVHVACNSADRDLPEGIYTVKSLGPYQCCLTLEELSGAWEVSRFAPVCRANTPAANRRRVLKALSAASEAELKKLVRG